MLGVHPARGNDGELADVDIFHLASARIWNLGRSGGYIACNQVKGQSPILPASPRPTEPYHSRPPLTGADSNIPGESAPCLINTGRVEDTTRSQAAGRSLTALSPDSLSMGLCLSHQNPNSEDNTPTGQRALKSCRLEPTQRTTIPWAPIAYTPRYRDCKSI